MHCDLDLWPFDPKVNMAHPWLMGSAPMKFHEDRGKGEAVMRMKPFYLTPCIVTLTFDFLTPRSTGPILWLMGSVPMKFHEDRCKGEAVMRAKPFYLTARLQTDGRIDRRTDGQGDSSIPPPNFVAGGIINGHYWWSMYAKYEVYNSWLQCEMSKLTIDKKI